MGLMCVKDHKDKRRPPPPSQRRSGCSGENALSCSLLPCLRFPTEPGCLRTCSGRSGRTTEAPQTSPHTPSCSPFRRHTRPSSTARQVPQGNDGRKKSRGKLCRREHEQSVGSEQWRRSLSPIPEGPTRGSPFHPLKCCFELCFR